MLSMNEYWQNGASSICSSHNYNNQFYDKTLFIGDTKLNS